MKISFCNKAEDCAANPVQQQGSLAKGSWPSLKKQGKLSGEEFDSSPLEVFGMAGIYLGSGAEFLQGRLLQ